MNLPVDDKDLLVLSCFRLQTFVQDKNTTRAYSHLTPSRSMLTFKYRNYVYYLASISSRVMSFSTESTGVLSLHPTDGLWYFFCEVHYGPFPNLFANRHHIYFQR
jgi:hypothetical protein